MTPAPADAAFSACGRYRWWLWRQWHRERPLLLFVGLNPSRADGARDDATLRRLVGFARQWDYGSLLVLNLFARISPSPALLRRAADPVGAETDAWLQRALTGTVAAAGGSIGVPAAVWLGWGNRGTWLGRDRQVLALLGSRAPLLCLGLTRQGQPRHPLYAPAGTNPQAWGILDTRTASPWPAPLAATPSICT